MAPGGVVGEAVLFARGRSGEGAAWLVERWTGEGGDAKLLERGTGEGGAIDSSQRARQAATGMHADTHAHIHECMDA